MCNLFLVLDANYLLTHTPSNLYLHMEFAYTVKLETLVTWKQPNVTVD